MRNYLFINALQNLLFCIPKAAVLHGKSVCFALQKSRFRNVKAQLSLFKGIILTKRTIACYSLPIIFCAETNDCSLSFACLSVDAFARQKTFVGIVMLHFLHICYKVGIVD
ncbi:hypothetical protein D2S45_04870 [Prevotella intermedia]|uniref:Uncharacterized protein n=1 Tax=Prevotella intermedia TaxID=28131 RepID=A0A3R7XLH7_PREIN|nr:hypothetical protein D2S53_04630 [Prevotella intermedia]RRF87652.1 hypothetical protein D2S45_04870 [Prevotella intermedia]